MEPGAAEAAWRPTLDDLNAPLPEYHFTMVKGSISFLTAAVAAHRLDFLITNPGHCFELWIDYSATAFASNRISTVRPKPFGRLHDHSAQ